MRIRPGGTRWGFEEWLAEPWAPLEDAWGTSSRAEAEARAMMGPDVMEPAPMRE